MKEEYKKRFKVDLELALLASEAVVDIDNLASGIVIDKQGKEGIKQLYEIFYNLGRDLRQGKPAISAYDFEALREMFDSVNFDEISNQSILIAADFEAVERLKPERQISLLQRCIRISRTCSKYMYMRNGRSYLAA